MILDSNPLISCVCVTKNRPNLVINAINCYLKQTYSNKNLFVLSQGDEESNRQINSYINSLNRSDIFFHTAPYFLSLGAMRNTSVELATGQIICQWDDDDLYHPDRILNQYQSIRRDNRNVASAYTSFLKYFENTEELYWCDWSGEPKLSHKFLSGSVMFLKSMFYSYDLFYPETGSQSSVEEDLNVLEKLTFKGSVASVSEGHQYTYVYHGINTYNFNHHCLTLNTVWGKKVYSDLELLDKKYMLLSTFKLIGIKNQIKVRSLEDVAFIFEPERNLS